MRILWAGDIAALLLEPALALRVHLPMPRLACVASLVRAERRHVANKEQEAGGERRERVAAARLGIVRDRVA